VFASKDSHGNPTSYTVWEHANMAPASGAFYGRAGEVALWAEGLDWMRTHTPDAGVDLAALVPKPPPGQLYDYPKQAYGVLTWWDYGHWIETIAERPPVANPFQQAAPFAAEWFTERDPERAEKLLDDWVQGKGPVRYVFIDDAIATGKFGAISVWAHSRNESRDVWADRDYRASATYQTSDGPKQLTTTGPEWEESMMGRLYDHDGNGLSHYRLVWEDPSYEVIGSASASDGGIECLHESLPGRGCPAGEPSKMAFIPQGTAINIDRSDGSHDYVYDTIVASRLKLFERVAGAHVRGKAAPGATVTIGARVAVQAENVTPTRGAFDYSITGTAGPDGTFDIVFPYSNAAFVAPKDGGTSLSAHVVGSIVVSSPGSGQAVVTVPDAAVLRGAPVEVPALK
jgi:dolichyl-diphosphooligosaccharide--protein glycosyltransferase